MATNPVSGFLEQLRKTAPLPDGGGATDGELLEGFVTGRDQAAFAALVRRHGPMVWDVCIRVLGGHQDAEDAFQATFLVLVRKAASVVPRAMVANWLYGVAHRTALNARGSAIRRQAHERHVTPMPEPAAPEQDVWVRLQPLLDQELSRLPAKYRAAIVLCDLEGKTRKEVAQQLGVPEGTLSGRLTRGRAMLGKRLTRRGLSLSGGAFALACSQNALSAEVPALVVSKTIHAAILSAAGQAAAAGLISARAAALTKGTVRTMFLLKLKAATAVLLILTAVGAGAAGLIYHSYSGNPTDSLVVPLERRAEEDPQTGAARRPEPPPLATRRDKSKPKFTIDRETTYITGPLDKDGNVDYETALNERLGKDVTPEKNANVLLYNALHAEPKRYPMPPEFFAWLKMPVPPEQGDYFVDLLRYAGDAFQVKSPEETLEIRKQRYAAGLRPWVAKDYPRISAWLAANEKPIGLVVEAARRPEYYNPLVSKKSGPEGWYGLLGSLLPAAVKCQREVAPALAARAMLHAGEGKYDQAWQELLALHRLGRLIARGADHDELLLGAAIDEAAGDAALALLDRAKPTSKQARAWLDDLDHLSPMPALAEKTDVGERFTFLNTVLIARRGPVKILRFIQILQGQPRLPPGTADPEVAQALIDALDWNAILRAGNLWYDRTTAVLRIADRAEREKEFARLEAELATRMKEAGTAGDVIEACRRAGNIDQGISSRLGVVLIDYFQRDIRRMKSAADRAEQVRRNLRLAFALAAYRHDHGRYPDALAALAPEYVKEVPNDFYSGKALQYRPAENKYRLYSVGSNGKDDGGNGFEDQPRGDDVCVRMPLPEFNRK